MALTELQLPTKQNFYGKLQNAASQMDILIKNWRDIAEFIGMVDASDLDAMGVAAGQVRTDLINFRSVLNEMIALYDGGVVTPTNPPNEIIDRIRHM